ATPTMMGQFPAAALVFREGMVPDGGEWNFVGLSVNDLLALKGTKLAQDAAFDELRLSQVPQVERSRYPNAEISPLVHFVGRVNVHFHTGGLAVGYSDATPFIDRDKKTIVAPKGNLKLDYGKGLLFIDAPRVQGVVGDLSSSPLHKTS